MIYVPTRRVRTIPDSVSDRLPFVEGLRGLAALYVVLGHFCSMADPRAFQGQTSRAPEWLQAVMAPLWNGHLAVAAFIVISGFCLQMSLFPGRSGRIESLWRFLSRRARRILPPYYACLAISTAVALTVTARQTEMPFIQYLPVTQENFVAHLLLVHNWSAAWMYKINGVLWSIGAEVQLYLIFPILVALMFRLGRVLTVLLTASAAAMVLSYYPEFVKLYPWYLALFTAGAASAHLAYRPALRGGTAPGLGLLVGLISFAGAVYAVSERLPMPIADGALGLSIAALLYAGAVSPRNPVARALSIRPLAGLGAMSYSLYLMHHPIQQIAFVNRPAWVQGEEMAFWFLLGVGLPTIMVGCWIFWWLFERPFQKRLIATSRVNSWVPVQLPIAAVRPAVLPITAVAEVEGTKLESATVQVDDKPLQPVLAPDA